MPIQLKSEALPPPRNSSEWQVRHAPEPRNNALPAAGSPLALTAKAAKTAKPLFLCALCDLCVRPSAAAAALAATTAHAIIKRIRFVMLESWRGSYQA